MAGNRQWPVAREEDNLQTLLQLRLFFSEARNHTLNLLKQFPSLFRYRVLHFHFERVKLTLKLFNSFANRFTRHGIYPSIIWL